MALTGQIYCTNLPFDVYKIIDCGKTTSSSENNLAGIFEYQTLSIGAILGKSVRGRPVSPPFS